jgi:hypothetical protein
MRRFCRHLKPGAYLEQAEQSVVPKSEDGSTAGTVFEQWGEVSLQAGDAFGKTLRIIDEAKGMMIAAGFVDVVEHRFKIPIGSWAKDPRLKVLGLYNRLQWEEGIEGWTMMLLTKFLGVRIVLLAGIGTDITDACYSGAAKKLTNISWK